SPYERDWRDRTVFNIAAEEIEEISISYDDQPMHSFVIKREGNDVKVQIDSALQGLGELNNNRLTAYLGFFTNVNCEGYTNGDLFMDSVIRSVPRKCVVDVKGKNGYHQSVVVYWR